MSKNKRMVYIKPENMEFYDGLENKSDFINGALETARLGGVTDLRTTEVQEAKASEDQSRQGLETYDAVEAMRQRDLKRLAEYRKRNGIAPPAGV